MLKFGVRCFIIFCSIMTTVELRAENSTTSVLSEDYSIETFGHFNKNVIHQKTYNGRGKWRVETISPQANLNQVMIVRKDKMLIWTLMPENKMYTEIPIDKVPSGFGDIDMTKFKHVGTEVVDGQMADKYLVLVDAPSNDCQSLFFVSKATRIPIKSDMECGGHREPILEYKNAVIGAPPADLFEIPEDYKKFPSS